MPNVFEYLDYRAFLRESFECAKKEKPFFSYRYVSTRVGINPGYIVKVLQGKVHLGEKNISAFADLFKLQDKEREYFVELVHFGRAKNPRDIEEGFNRLGALKGVRFRTVADDQADFYRQWYHMVIRSLLSIYPFDGSDYRGLAARLSPRVPVSQVRESVALLERLNLIRRDEKGFYLVTDQYITTGEKWTAGVIRDYQKANMELAAEALERHDKDLRDVSTVTMTFSLKELPALRERVAQFRQELLRLSEDCTNEDAVMQLNIQFFPVAFPEREA